MTRLVNPEKIGVDVTQEQINKCFKCYNFNTGEDYYICESSDSTDQYMIRFDCEKGFTCTCEAGKYGFAHCRNYCWHVRASVASWLENEALKEQMREAEEALANKIAKQPTVILPGVKPLPVSSIEESMPEWLKRAKPAPHMRYAPREY